jgi:wee1-like protein kinase
MLWIAPFKERPRTLTDFEIIRLLGEGVSSTVHSCRKRLDGQLYALKKIKRKINSENEGKHFLKEAQAHAALIGCPNITQYFGCWIDDGHLSIQTELCSYGSLDVFVKKPNTCFNSDNDNSFGDDSHLMSQQSNNDDQNISISTPNIPESFAWLILYKISEALAYMHGKEIAHLDLRPANIFIADPNCNDDIDLQNITQNYLAEKIVSGEYVLKLGDLGHASKLDETNFVEEGEGRYVAKELINSIQKVDFAKADMFSLGATVYEICLGKALGTGAWEWHALRNSQFDRSFFISYSKELCDCIISLMDPSPLNRPSSIELFELLKLRYNNSVMSSLSMELDDLKKELEYLRNENVKLKNGSL